MRTIVTLESKIFDKTVRQQAVTNLISRQSRDFRDKTKGNMIESRPTGHLYRRKGGAGFRRSHIASSIGQRPSPDTLTLANAVTQKMTGDTTAEVFIAERVNPVNGQAASKYAEILQTKLERPIMSPADAEAAQAELDRKAEALAGELAA